MKSEEKRKKEKSEEEEEEKQEIPTNTPGPKPRVSQDHAQKNAEEQPTHGRR